MKSKYLYLVPLFLFIVLFSFGGSVIAADKDLLIDSVAFDPVQPVVGQTTKIIVKARYYGTNPLTINYGVDNVAFSHSDFWQIDSSNNGSSIKPASYNPLYSGAEFTYVFTGRFTGGGEKMLVFKIDGYNQLAEYNEYNNIINVNINVLQTGDLIKLTNDPAVYMIGDDGKKHLYVNAPTFWSYYRGSWGNLILDNKNVYIKIISQANFDEIDIGKNITMKPGAKLVKFQNSPRIYSVFGSAKLRYMSDQTVANLYGYNWGNKVITLQNGFESDYFLASQDFVDSDGDVLSDEDEFSIYRTNPYNVDTDHDGHRDGVEVINSYSPII